VRTLGRNYHTLYDWLRAEGVALTEEALAGVPPGHGALHASTGSVFRDPARLGKWVVALLLGVAGASTAAFFMIFARVQFLENVALGFYRSRSSFMETAQLLDTLVRIASLLYLGIWIAAAILFLKWVYRSNRNAREMGVAGLKFTPGWAVGCYFVPFANLGLPFLAMREIWNASLGRVEGTARPAYLVGASRPSAQRPSPISSCRDNLRWCLTGSRLPAPF